MVAFTYDPSHPATASISTEMQHCTPIVIRVSGDLDGFYQNSKRTLFSHVGRSYMFNEMVMFGPRDIDLILMKRRKIN